ncbi:hypothetical protein MKX64_10515 [Paenibacillus sp. FSL M8-0334]
MVAEYADIRFDSVAAYNGKLYMSNAGTVYEMGTGGNMTTIVKMT